jgi:hypothetical protein
VAQLNESLAAGALKLTVEEMQELETASAWT